MSVKVAAVHASSVFLDLERSTKKACDLIEQAGNEGARLVVFPEAFIPGYPFWIWTHTPRDGAHLFHDFFKNSVEIPGQMTELIGEAAKKAGVFVVMGLTEREGGTLYNTLLYFNDAGEIIGKHRKLQPTHVERTVWGRGDGRDLNVVDTSIGKLGGLICWEHTMDLVRYSMACLGEQIHIAAWPGISAVSHDPNSEIFDSVTEAAAKHHAVSSQSFVINAQSCIDKETIRILGLEDKPDMIRTGGGWTAIIGPNGQFISGPNRDDEKILYGDIDLDDVIYMKYAVDSVGHYARPDIVRLNIDRQPQPIYEVNAAMAENEKTPVESTDEEN